MWHELAPAARRCQRVVQTADVTSDLTIKPEYISLHTCCLGQSLFPLVAPAWLQSVHLIRSAASTTCSHTAAAIGNAMQLSRAVQDSDCRKLMGHLCRHGSRMESITHTVQTDNQRRQHAWWSWILKLQHVSHD